MNAHREYSNYGLVLAKKRDLRHDSDWELYLARANCPQRLELIISMRHPRWQADCGLEFVQVRAQLQGVIVTGGSVAVSG